MHAILVWFNRDFWQPIWPNLAASAVVGTLAVMKVRDHLRKHHETLMGEIKKIRGDHDAHHA